MRCVDAHVQPRHGSDRGSTQLPQGTCLFTSSCSFSPRASSSPSRCSRSSARESAWDRLRELFLCAELGLLLALAGPASSLGSAGLLSGPRSAIAGALTSSLLPACPVSKGSGLALGLESAAALLSEGSREACFLGLLDCACAPAVAVPSGPPPELLPALLSPSGVRLGCCEICLGRGSSAASDATGADDASRLPMAPELPAAADSAATWPSELSEVPSVPDLPAAMDLLTTACCSVRSTTAAIPASASSASSSSVPSPSSSARLCEAAPFSAGCSSVGCCALGDWQSSCTERTPSDIWTQATVDDSWRNACHKCIGKGTGRRPAETANCKVNPRVTGTSTERK